MVFRKAESSRFWVSEVRIFRGHGYRRVSGLRVCFWKSLQVGETGEVVMCGSPEIEGH